MQKKKQKQENEENSISWQNKNVKITKLWKKEKQTTKKTSKKKEDGKPLPKRYQLLFVAASLSFSLISFSCGGCEWKNLFFISKRFNSFFFLSFLFYHIFYIAIPCCVCFGITKKRRKKNRILEVRPLLECLDNKDRSY